MKYNSYNLGELIKINNGKDYRHLDKGNIPVYGSGGIICSVSDKLYSGESILLPRKGTLDNIMYINGDFWTVDTMYWAVVTNPCAYPRYLYLYLRLLDLGALNSGSALPSMTNTAYNMVPISLPDIETQKRVADFIFKILDKIETNNKLSATLEATAKTIYDYWFTQFDFPDENGKPYRSSGGKMVWNETLKREIPAGWVCSSLNEILCLVGENIKDIVGHEKLFYSPIDCLPMKKMTFAGGLSSEEANSSLQLYEENDILLGAMRVYFHRVCIAAQNGITRGTTMVLKPTNKELLGYSYQVLNEEKAINYATVNSVGTQQPYINWNNALENYKFPKPVQNGLLEKYSIIVVPIIEKTKEIAKENLALTSLRDYLLPLLMNGQATIGG